MPTVPVPTELPDWATNANHALGPNNGLPNKVALTLETTEGNVDGPTFPPDARKFNHWQNLVGRWTRALATLLPTSGVLQGYVPNADVNQDTQWVAAPENKPEGMLPIGTSVASVDAVYGWRPYLEAAALAGPITLTKNKTYLVASQWTAITGMNVRGNGAWIKWQGVRSSTDVMHFNGVTDVHITDLNVDGSLSGGGTAAQTANCVNIVNCHRISWLGGVIKDPAAAAVNGQAVGMRIIGTNTFLNIRLDSMTQSASASVNGSFGLHVFAVCTDCEFHVKHVGLDNFKSGIVFDAGPYLRCNSTADLSAADDTLTVHGVQFGYASVNTYYGIKFAGSVTNAAGQGIYATGSSLLAGQANYGLELGEIVLKNCGGGHASIGLNSLFIGHRTLKCKSLRIINGGRKLDDSPRAYSSGSAPLFYPSTPEFAGDISFENLEFENSYYSDAVVYNIDLLDIGRFRSKGAFSNFTGYSTSGSNVDAAGSRRTWRIADGKIDQQGSNSCIDFRAGSTGACTIEWNLDLNGNGDASAAAFAGDGCGAFLSAAITKGYWRGRVSNFKRPGTSGGIVAGSARLFLDPEGCALDLDFVDVVRPIYWHGPDNIGSVWKYVPAPRSWRNADPTTSDLAIAPFTSTMKMYQRVNGRLIVMSTALPTDTLSDIHWQIGDEFWVVTLSGTSGYITALVKHVCTTRGVGGTAVFTPL